MDSRSKYANLPFVAIGERDVFETEDTPEPDQLPVREPLWDVSVDVIACGTLEAFQRFNDTKNEQIIEKTTSESLLDKYNRLKEETEELIDFASKDTNGSNKDLVSKVDKLSQQLQELQVMGYDNSNTLKNVFESLDKPVTKSGHSGDNNDNSNESEVKYQLYYKPEHSRLHDSSKLNSLEQRIKRIETALGGNENKLSLFNNHYKDKSLTESVRELSAKVAQFDQSSLERVDSRLHMITDKLSQIAERKAQFEELDKTSKLNELYDLVNQSEKNRASLPNVLERLETLSELQEQAMQFSSALSYLDSLQSQVTDSMKSNEKQLDLMKESFEKNVESIKQILLDFDKRLQTLK